MKHLSILTKIAVAALALHVAMPAAADVTAVQCNKERGGIWVPVLHVKLPNQKLDLFVGDRGLTRDVLYHEDRIEDFVRQVFGLGDQDITALLNCGTVEEPDIDLAAGPVPTGPAPDREPDTNPQTEDEYDPTADYE